VTRALTALGLVAALAAIPAAAQEPARDDVERIVRELLQREPEIVIEAIQAFQQRQEEERAANAQAAIEAHRPALQSAEHPSVGPADAAVTLVEFFDYRCGYCRRMVPALEALKAAHEDVRFVYVEFPVLGPDSLRAAQASLAAWVQDPGAYWDFHKAMMSADDLSAPAIEELAAAHGLDTDRLIDDMQSPAVRERIEANYAMAQAIGVEGTPAFVIGDTFLPGAVPLERLEAAIVDARPLE
jgi:protein-disulfide isomerase